MKSKWLNAQSSFWSAGITSWNLDFELDLTFRFWYLKLQAISPTFCRCCGPKRLMSPSYHPTVGRLQEGDILAVEVAVT